MHKNLKCLEPANFRRMLLRQTQQPPNYLWSFVYLIAITLGLFAAGMIVPSLRGQPRQCTAGTGFPISFAVAVPFSFILPYYGQFVPAEVRLSEEGFARQSFHSVMVRMEKIPWDQIDFCGFATMDVSGKAFRALAIRSKNGDTLLVGLRRRFREEEIRSFIETHGIKWKDVDEPPSRAR
jgi:hypothetical protein